MAKKAGKHIYRIMAMLLVVTMLTTSITPISYASERTETLPQGEPICGYEEHLHTKDCYEAVRTLICTPEDHIADGTSGSSVGFVKQTTGSNVAYESYIHSDSCYIIEQILQCVLPIHMHTEACYAAEEEKEEKEEQQELRMQTLTTTGSSVSVSGILPEGAALAVRDLTDEEYEALPVELDQLLFAYDITILVDGEEYQPEEPVTVSVTPQMMTYSLREPMPYITVHHVTGVDANGEMNVETVARDAMNDEGIVTFTADSFSVYYGVMQVDEPGSIIYFDLSAGDVTINGSSYTGYRYDGADTAQEISGTWAEGQSYYVYQSNGVKNTGLIGGNIVLPQYDRVTYNGESWGEYITNHPNGRTDGHGEGANSGSESVKTVIVAWETATEGKRQATEHSIKFTGNVGNIEMVIDNLWSSYQGSGQGRTHGSIGYNTYGTNYENNQITLNLKGDNRLANIFYATKSNKQNDPEFHDTGNRLIFDYYGTESDATLTVANNSTNLGGQWWNAAIGSSDSYDACYGLVFNGGIIYAGTTANDDCTAIGGGGNGAATVVINGGTITAVSNTSGSSIGGGIGKSAQGGSADITIKGGTVFAYNFGYGRDYTGKNYNRILSSAIGGGSSSSASGCKYARVKIDGGNVYAQSVGGTAIGGGSSTNSNGGNAEVAINGGNVEAKSIGGSLYQMTTKNIVTINPGAAIGGGTGNAKGGYAKLTVNEVDSVNYPTTLITGSIGGGGYTAATGTIGAADVIVTGGIIKGQAIMAAGSESHCSFTMTGGTWTNNTDTSYTYLQPNGGAVWMDDPNGVAILSGGTIQGCTAENGGAVYMTAGTFTLSGEGTIQNCVATGNNVNATAGKGGAVYLGSSGSNKGTFIMTGGTISGNTANDVGSNHGLGGAIYLAGGDATISGGMIGASGTPNNAHDGGGVYLAGGQLNMNGGSLAYNTAANNGGGAYVAGGNIEMTGGIFANNTSANDGGGAYLTGGTLTMVGGSFTDNTATNNGGGAYINGGDFIFGKQDIVQDQGAIATLTGNKAQSGAGVYLTDGTPSLYQGTLSENIASNDGGGIYINEKEVILSPRGTVLIIGNEASRGAGIYIYDGDIANANLAGFSVNVASEGNVVMQENNALAEGGGVCINSGYFTLDSDKITLLKNHAQSGGAVAVLSGDFNMSNGAIGAEGNGNTAENGGAVYVAGGDVNVTGGYIHYNTANKDGGGIYVKDGNYTQVGGNIDNNTATTGKGGGVFASANTTNVEAKVLSGTVSDNTAGTHGGAIAVVGNNSATVKVTIGVNEQHFNADGTRIDCDHDEKGTDSLVQDSVLPCPVVSYNKVTSTTNSGGGAVYVTEGNGSADKTLLYIYCLKAEKNDVATTDDTMDSLSDFMLVEGGTVQVSTALNPTEQNQTATYGCIDITGNMYVVGGKVDLWGNTKNPTVNGIITVDIADSEEYCNDHRVVEGLYTVTYYENMGDGTTRYNSYPIFVDSSSSTAVTLKSNIFTRPGYELLGWHTSSNAQPDRDAHTSGDWNTAAWYEGWYDMNSTHTFGQANGQHKSNLELYAIWRANGYTVQFDANVPSGISYENNYSNQDATQTLNYGVEANLISNQYFYPGHIFTGWNTKADGSGTPYNNGQAVKNLAQKGTITLYAQWKVCPHDNTQDSRCTFTYTASGATLTKACSCKAYSESITISAENATYDGHPHRATLSSDKWGLTPQYKKGGDKLSGAPVDAGTYTASITAGNKTASVTYTIAKAPQDAPEKPTFEVVNSTLTVDEITSPGAPGSVPMYQLVYYTINSEVQLEATDKRIFTLPTAYTSYYVQVWYSEGDNHFASAIVKSTQTHYFEGEHLTINVDSEDGIEYQLVKNTDSGLSIDVRAKNGYYLANLLVEEKEPKLTTIAPATKKDGWEKSYNMTDIPNGTAGTPVVINVTISGAKKGVSIDAQVVENQVFGEVVGDTDAYVTNESSYTAYFDVKDYDIEVYSGLSVKFSSVPSKVILLDKSDNSYWYCNEPSSMIALSSFIRMGTETVKYNVSGTQLKLQFIVDGVTADTTTTLVATPKAGKNALAQDRSVTTYVDTATFELSTTNNRTMTQTIAHTYTVPTVPTVTTRYTDTRYDHRHGALVLEELVLEESDNVPLPADARISVTIGNAEAVYYKNGSNQFVIPLGGITTGRANITLVSDFLPDTEASYALTAQWIASDSIADLAPANGDVLATQDIIFTSAAKSVPAINISSENRLVTAGTEYSVTIEYKNIPQNATAYITLYRKTDTGGFAPAGAAQSISLPDTAQPIPYRISIPSDRTGSAYLHLELKEGLGVIKEIDYHFIIQNPSTNNPDGSASTTV